MCQGISRNGESPEEECLQRVRRRLLSLLVERIGISETLADWNTEGRACKQLQLNVVFEETSYTALPETRSVLRTIPASTSHTISSIFQQTTNIWFFGEPLPYSKHVNHEMTWSSTNIWQRLIFRATSSRSTWTSTGPSFLKSSMVGTKEKTLSASVVSRDIIWGPTDWMKSFAL